jgi:putative transposase
MVDDPAHYRWSNYRANALGEPDALMSQNPLYLALGVEEGQRRCAYRELFRDALDEKPISDLGLALNQDQPTGTDRFYREIEALTGQRRELRKCRRPLERDEQPSVGDSRQHELPL